MTETSPPTRLDAVADFTIFNAAGERQRLLDALAACEALEIDLSHVSEIDSAGLQLILAAKREAAARRIPLRFIGRSAAVADILELCDLAGEFVDADPLPDATRN